MFVKVQKVRPDTKYESYRISIPKAIIKHYKLKDKKFKIEVSKNGKITLTPIKPK